MKKYYLESRSMIMTSRDLDELAYLLHANVHRGDYEQIGNPAKVEERKLFKLSIIESHTQK
jgi:hypothetical protein